MNCLIGNLGLKSYYYYYDYALKKKYNMLEIRVWYIISLRSCKQFYLQMVPQSFCNPNKAFEQM